MIEIADNLTRTAEAAFDDGGWAQVDSARRHS